MIKKFKPLFTLRKKPKSEIDNSSEEQSLYSNSNLDSSKKIETTPIEESIENKSYNSRYTHISDYNVKSDYNRNSSLFSDELNNNDYDNNELGSTFNIPKTEDEIEKLRNFIASGKNVDYATCYTKLQELQQRLLMLNELNQICVERNRY